MDIHDYIKAQITLFDRKASNKQLKSNLNAIYAILESRGYSRSEISLAIETIIKENLHVLNIQLQIDILSK
jgi:hypothetical protein